MRFYKQGSPDAIGMLTGVQGLVSFAVQFSVIDDEAEMIPF